MKRFVNIVQLLLAMPPELGGHGPASDREIVAFAAALNSGMPDVANGLFTRARRTPTTTLEEALTDIARGGEASADGVARLGRGRPARRSGRRCRSGASTSGSTWFGG